MSEAVQPAVRELPPEFKTFTRKNGSVAKIRQKPKAETPAAEKPKEAPPAAERRSSGWVVPVVVGVLAGGCLLVAAVAVVKHTSTKPPQQTMH